jgi:hypothetical protein
LPAHDPDSLQLNIGGGFGNKVPVYPGYVRDRRSIVAGAPSGGSKTARAVDRLRPIT